jgi:hypothetical protein
LIRKISSIAGYLIALLLLLGVALPIQAFSPVQSSDPGAVTDRNQYQIYLGGVSKNRAACGVVPNLISPADGSTLTTSVPTFVFNGGSRPQANATWLQFDLSQKPNFSEDYDFYPLYFQPAQKDWVYQVSPGDAIPPGTYYWRAALWCNGPGWPPPPNPGEVRGPYSKVFSFTIQP